LVDEKKLWIQVDFMEQNHEYVISYGDGRRQILDRASNVSEASASRYTRFKAGHPAGFVEALANLYTDIHEALGQYKATAKQESQEVFGASLALEGLSFLEAIVMSGDTERCEEINS
jgi:hypothetical protein